MKVFITLVRQADDDEIVACDTIEHEGKFWLVPEWLTGPIAGTEKPARLIGLHGLPTQPAGLTYRQYHPNADSVLLIPLSKDTLAGGTAQGLDAIHAPDITRSVGEEPVQH
jgi:hypothetical protein